jgi:hypothetical protein
MEGTSLKILRRSRAKEIVAENVPASSLPVKKKMKTEEAGKNEFVA